MSTPLINLNILYFFNPYTCIQFNMIKTETLNEQYIEFFDGGAI